MNVTNADFFDAVFLTVDGDASAWGTSQAEKRVFDRLRAVSFDEKQGNYTAYHSLNLTRHAYKRFGEIDFLICGPKGLYAIEVKGGRVSCKDGVWNYTNRYRTCSIWTVLITWMLLLRTV